MLSPEAFEQWCWRLGLSDEAKAVITQIRTSPPARHVQSGAGNFSGTYPSIKMGCAIQFESLRDELPFVYLMDHDPQMLEFYDQPSGQHKLKYRSTAAGISRRDPADCFVSSGRASGAHSETYPSVPRAACNFTRSQGASAPPRSVPGGAVSSNGYIRVIGVELRKLSHEPQSNC
jgi:hypothetical protein